MAEPTVQVPVSQCPAVNDGMEGVRCHGDAGHAELHWADVSGDSDVTEWGDNDELWDEIDRLRTLLSQPTPTAKPVCTCGSGRSAHSRDNLLCERNHAPAAPPRIADMVPGTTCDECGGSGVCGGPPDRYYDCPRCSGEPVNLDDTVDDRDPSTIRDVTAPPVTP